jgi:Ca2+-binding RTX toxin-like protein
LSSYVLGADLYNLTSLGTGEFVGTGNDRANVITGGLGDDLSSGEGAGDTLSGGAGNDTLTGGRGSDTYLSSGVLIRIRSIMPPMTLRPARTSWFWFGDRLRPAVARPVGQ